MQAPTIYRLFGDKEGLLDAVAEHVVATYVDTTAGREPGDEPLLAQPPPHRNLELADTMYDAVARSILTDTRALDTDSTATPMALT